MPEKTVETTGQKTAPRNKRKSLVGHVVSNKMDRTVVVVVERRFRHPLYKKSVTRRKRHYAHDAQNACNIGDTVRIAETRPVSKLKRWRVAAIVAKAR
jgi:small subunit ribosomal protein S17